MLTPDYYESCVDDILKLYAQLEDDIISDIVRRMMKTGFVTESAKHQAEMLQNAGLLYDDILSEIAKRTDATSQHVKALFEDAGVRTVNFDNQIYRAVGRVPVDIRQSPAMRQTLESGYRKTLGNMQNLTLTTANMAQSTYYSACNQAYMQVVSGAFSYQEAIKKAVQKTAQDGAFVLYPSGHRDRVDVAVRRSVLTGVGQTCREIGLMNAEENDCDLMELSAHFGTRPTHAEWQGQIVSLSGRKGYLSLDSIGYGTGDGFGGWNCRHDWFPYFEGYSRRNYTDDYLKSLNEKNIEYNGEKYSQYEISQIQRRYEREIRSAKREKVAFDTAVKESADPELKAVMKSGSDYANQQIKDKQAKMHDFINQTGQSRDYFREQNYGKVIYPKNNGNSLTSPVNNVIIKTVRSSGKNNLSDHINYYEKIGNIDFSDKKAVARSLMEFEEKYKNSGVEHCRVITALGEIYEVHGNKWTVDTSLLGDKLKDSINEHNHVTGESQYSFSWEDLKSCADDGTKIAIAYDEKYRYSMVFPDEIISKDDLYDAYYNAKNQVGDIRSYDRFYNRLTISDEDVQHEVIKRACEMVGIKYGRQGKK